MKPEDVLNLVIELGIYAVVITCFIYALRAM